MNFLLIVLALLAAGALFYYPVEPVVVPYLEYTLIGLLVLSLVVQIVQGFLRARTRKGGAVPVAEKEAPAAVAPAAETAVEAGVVQFLGRLQEKGRFVDFVMDDVTPYSNEQIGAAARVVHQGCREVLLEAFDIQPVHGGEEREPVTLSAEYDAAAYRLVGRVPEEPPYKGVVLHKGWRTSRVKLPRVTEPARRAAAREVIAPAEVEIE